MQIYPHGQTRYQNYKTLREEVAKMPDRVLSPSIAIYHLLWIFTLKTEEVVIRELLLRKFAQKCEEVARMS
jgi:hypothetical protein